MSYVITANSTANPLANQQPQQLFPTAYIQDGVVQQNFETLNKLLAALVNGGTISPANIVFGPAFATGSVSTQFTGSGIQTPGLLQVQIPTRGNPVKIKVAPFPLATGAESLFALSVAGNFMQAQFGWYRYGLVNGIQTKANIGSVTFVHQGQKDSASGLLMHSLQLPAFEMEDAVPTGIYTYQFFLQLFTAGMVLNVSQINAVAYELR